MIGTLFHEAAHQFVSLATSAVGLAQRGPGVVLRGLPHPAQRHGAHEHAGQPPAVPARRAAWSRAGWPTPTTASTRPSPRTPTRPKAPDLPHRAREQVRVGPALVRADLGRRVLPLQLPGPGRRPLRLPRRLPRVRQHVRRPRRRGRGQELRGGRAGQPPAAHPGRRAPRGDWPTAGAAAHDRRARRGLEGLAGRAARRAARRAGRRAAVPALGAVRGLATRTTTSPRSTSRRAWSATPRDVDLLLEFADLLAERDGNTDRATKLALAAVRALESGEEVDLAAVREVERKLEKLGPQALDARARPSRAVGRGAPPGAGATATPPCR